AVISLSILGGAAQAQLARTFVSAGIGNDGNDCNRLTPCRTFQRAHDNTLTGGEITVLDSGGYGAVTITKTIAITNDGVGEAGTMGSGGANGVTIKAGPSDSVAPRGPSVTRIGFGRGNRVLFPTRTSPTLPNPPVPPLSPH